MTQNMVFRINGKEVPREEWMTRSVEGEVLAIDLGKLGDWRPKKKRIAVQTLAGFLAYVAAAVTVNVLGPDGWQTVVTGIVLGVCAQLAIIKALRPWAWSKSLSVNLLTPIPEKGK